MAEAQKTLNEVAGGFRKTAAGAKLGKILFDPATQNKISVTDIATLLRQAGLPVTNEMRVGAATAQIIIAGGSFANSASAANQIKAVTAPTLAIINGTLEILDAIGLMSKKEPAAQGVSFLGSAALMMSCGGLNILADVAFVFQIIGFLLTQDKPVDIAKVRSELLKQSVEKAKSWLKGRTETQLTTAASLFGQYHSGDLSIFQMMGGVAQKSPDLFLKYFPEFEAFIPYTSNRHCESSSKVIYVPESEGANDNFSLAFDAIDSGKWPIADRSKFPYGIMQNGYYVCQAASADDYQRYRNSPVSRINGWMYYTPENFSLINQARNIWVYGRHENTDEKRFQTISEEFCFDYQSIKNYSTSELQTVFLRKYVGEPFAPYQFLQSMSPEKLKTYGYPPTANLKEHARPIPRISIQDLAILSLMPPYFSRLDNSFDLARFLVALEITPDELGYEGLLDSELEKGDLSHAEVLKSAPISFNGVDYFTDTQFKENSIIRSSNREIQDAILYDERGDVMNLMKIPRVLSIMKEFGTMPWLPPEIEMKMWSQARPEQRDYRNIQNYWGAVSVLESMLKDPYFQDAQNSPYVRELRGFFPDMKSFEERHKTLNFLSTSKKLNAESRKNIAGFFGEADVTKMRWKPVKEGELAAVLPPPIEVRSKPVAAKPKPLSDLFKF